MKAAKAKKERETKKEERMNLQSAGTIEAYVHQSEPATSLSNPGESGNGTISRLGDK